MTTDRSQTPDAARRPRLWRRGRNRPDERRAIRCGCGRTVLVQADHGWNPVMCECGKEIGLVRV